MSTMGVFIGLKKGFDTNNLYISVKKLQHYGVRGVAFEWINSYSGIRKQYPYMHSR